MTDGVAKFYLNDGKIVATKLEVESFVKYLKNEYFVSKYVIITNPENKILFIPTTNINFIILNNVLDVDGMDIQITEGEK